MSGDSAELHAVLEDLHAQLEAYEASEPVDPALREELRRAVADIESHLAGSEGAGGSVGDRLSGLVERFEGSHPRLAEAVGRLIHGIAELGI